MMRHGVMPGDRRWMARSKPGADVFINLFIIGIAVNFVG